MMQQNQLILEAARAHLGIEEWPGAKHNPKILEFYDKSGHGYVQDDETPWCAAFVNSILATVGIPHTGKLNARSYNDWGQEVSFTQAQPGDIVVFWRGSPSGWQGHVAIFVRREGDMVIVLGGNQGNRVSETPYPLSRILSIRRWTGADTAYNTERPTLRITSKGTPKSLVAILQGDLKLLGYFAGKVDGIFGPLTKQAVMAFQSDNDLATDGVVGHNTWLALDEAKIRPERTVSEQDLRNDGSRTIAESDKVQKGVVMGGAGAIVTVALEKSDEITKTLEQATGWFDIAQGFVLEYWLVIAIAAAVFLIWRYAGKIKEFRVEDAKLGKHIGR